jgi:N-acetylated-alpha-linked acidic dipeptidase
MGSGSDYTVFFDHLGIPSLDMNLFEGQKSVYLYHSNYDSYYWVNKFGDPGFKKHLAVAQLFGVLAVKLADTKIIPFQGVEYAVALEKHSKELKLAVKGKVDTKILDENISSFRKAVEKLDAEAEALKLTEVETLNLNPAAAETQKRIAAINKRYMSIERGFLRKDGGLPGREWFKHMVFAPGLWLGYQGVAFPGVLEALDDGDADGARGWVERIAGAINDLAGEL